MNEILMYVITHKKFDMKMPKDYKKLLVGSYNKEKIDDYLYDSIGENISEKNKSYCELTGLYWIWKNSKYKYIGLCHYRRFFVKYVGKPLSSKNIIRKLKNKDIILPYKRQLKKTMYEEYAEEHYSKDLDNCENIIKQEYPEYLDSYKYVMNQKSMYFCNMFIAKKELIDQYCEWLFNILNKLEKITDLTDYDDYQKRIYGFLAERLFNVWIYYKKLNIEEMDIWITEKTIFSEIKRILKRKIKEKKK